MPHDAIDDKFGWRACVKAKEVSLTGSHFAMMSNGSPVSRYLYIDLWSKLSVSMAYFCANFIIIMQLSFVRQGWCFPTYFPKFFLKLGL